MNTDEEVNQARAYIEYFAREFGKNITMVGTSTGRVIEINNMPDEDAIFVARQFAAMEAEAYSRTPRAKND